MSRRKISVIVPAYNTEDTLPKCLNSILSQDEQDWECIVVNDGSTDNTMRILERYAAIDNRFIIISQPNKGVSAARNRGLDEAQGKYITFIDSDDYVDADYFSRSVSLMNEYGATMLISGYVEEQYTLAEGRDITKRAASKMPKIFKANRAGIYVLNRVQCANLLFDTTASYWGYLRNWFLLDIIRTKAIKFNEDLRYNEDRDFTFAYIAHESLTMINIVVNRPAYHYIIRNSSAMHDGFNANHLDELDSFKHFCNIERRYFKNIRLNAAIRHAGLKRKYYLTWLAMNMERYDNDSAYRMEKMEDEMLSIRDFFPPYSVYSRHMMKRWLQNRKYRVLRFLNCKK